MTKCSKLSCADARALLAYDATSGELRWRHRGVEWFADGAHTKEHICARWNSRCAGKLVGRLDHDGYRMLTVFGVSHRAVRLIWLIATGRWPEKEVDHINGLRSDDRFCNLREATRAENSRNRPKREGTRFKLKGVSKLHNRYAASIGFNGAHYYLGCFSSEEEAHSAYKDAAFILHGNFARFK